MKKLLFLSILLLATAGFAATPNTVRNVADSPDVIGGTTAAAVEKVTVSYKGESEALTPFERGFADFNDLRYYEVHWDGKRTLASLTEIVCTAYTTGLSREIEFDGQKGTFIDYCGLRDKHIHPARWHDELGIDNYVYYVAKFQ